MYLIDTCVISEPLKEKPDPGLSQWLANVDEDSLMLSTLTIGEIEKGIRRLAKGKKRDHLREWVTSSLIPRFHRRIAPIDLGITIYWGELTAKFSKKGRNITEIDSLILATAGFHGWTIVTRNVDDFKGCGVDLLNPWSK